MTCESEGVNGKGGERENRNTPEVQGSQSLRVEATAVFRNVGYQSHSVTSQTAYTFSVALRANNVA
jgi:hypothetical protein